MEKVMNAMTEQPRISMTAYGLTDVGKRRVMNEDALVLTDFISERHGMAKLNLDRIGERGTLLAVADGMGGAEAGEVASAMAVLMLRHSLQQVSLQGAPGQQLRQAVEYANTRIWRYAQQHPQLKGMGTTLTAALVRGDIAYLAQVGDSRAYLIRGRRIQQLTRDQSLVQKMLDAGLLTPEEAARNPYRHVILQSLGGGAEVEVTLGAIALERHDYLLLCSDGLSNKITAAEMQQIVQEAASPGAACQRLAALANKRGGEDNITVIVAQFTGQGLSTVSADMLTNDLGALAKAA